MNTLERFVALAIIANQVKKNGYKLTDISEFRSLNDQELMCEFEFWTTIDDVLDKVFDGTIIEK